MKDWFEVLENQEEYYADAMHGVKYLKFSYDGSEDKDN